MDARLALVMILSVIATHLVATPAEEPLIVAPRPESCIEMLPVELFPEYECEEEEPIPDNEWSDEENE